MNTRVVVKIVLAVLTVGGACLFAHAASDDPASQPVFTAMPNDAATTGDVAELENLIRDGKITELRRTLNGSYGASLSYCPESMIYYAALFQQNKYWRVFKTQNDARAESVYSDFARSSLQLADAEIRRIKLESQKAYADRQIAEQQDRANRLQSDIDIARAQQSQVTSYQIEQQEAIRTLRTEQAAAQAQLRALTQRVQDLQRQTDVDVPAPAR